jgi:hypothetical protein
MSIDQIPEACRLPPITVCTFCNGEVDFVDNSVIYGKSYGKQPMVYRCNCCGAYVGAHPGTIIPLGTLADGKLREARKRAHSAFDHIWRDKGKSRGAAYRWLSEKLGVQRHACHIAWFDAATCARVVEFSTQYLKAHGL